MSLLSALGAGIFAFLAGSTSLVATDVIRAGDQVTLANISTEAGDVAPADASVLGREVRRTVYAGQQVTLDNTRPPRVVTRNQIVVVKYIDGGLEISTTGRAMGEAAASETVSVLNLQSKQMVSGIVQKEGWVLAQ